MTKFVDVLLRIKDDDLALIKSALEPRESLSEFMATAALAAAEAIIDAVVAGEFDRHKEHLEAWDEHDDRL